LEFNNSFTIQFGMKVKITSGTTYTITLPISFSNKNASVVVTSTQKTHVNVLLVGHHLVLK